MKMKDASIVDKGFDAISVKLINEAFEPGWRLEWGSTNRLFLVPPHGNPARGLATEFTGLGIFIPAYLRRALSGSLQE